MLQQAERISVMVYAYLYEDQVADAVTIWFVNKHGNTIATKHDLSAFGLEHLTPEYFDPHPVEPDQFDERGRKCVRFLTLLGDSKIIAENIRKALGDPTQYTFEVAHRAMPQYMRDELADAEFWAQVPNEKIREALARSH